MTEAEFRAETLARLDRIEGLLRGDPTAPLLREIARVVGAQSFTANEITARCESDARLRAALDRAVGLAAATRRLGKLLARCEGRSIGGVLVARHGDSNVGGVWGVKLTAPVASASLRDDDAHTRRAL